METVEISQNSIIPKINLQEPEEGDSILEWAYENIAEDSTTKLELIQQFRDMIYERGECNPDNTEDDFLIKFLRARRFVVRMAHRLLVNYCNFKLEYSHYFTVKNFEKLLQIGKSSIFSVPPLGNFEGRRILIVRLGEWNTNEFTVDDLFQSIIFLIQMANLDPRHQILGSVCLFDASSLALTKHITYLTPSVVNNMLRVSYKALPHRIESLHIINSNKIFDYAYGWFKPLLSSYVQDKVILHENLESLHQVWTPEFLPKRYGGVHKDYGYAEWMEALNNKNNSEILTEKIEEIGYIGIKEFLQQNLKT